MARKLEDPRLKLSKVISVKVTDGDNSAWMAKVKASGRTSAEFFRQAVLANHTTVSAIPVVSPISLEVLHCHQRTSNAIEKIVDEAIDARRLGVLSRWEFLSVVARLASVAESFRTEVRLAV